MLYEIVGAHFRPPAKALIAGISQGTTLYLRAEPTNAFDPNAIQVLLMSSEINLVEDTENLNKELSGYGKDISDILASPEWHLGYIRREIAKVFRESQIILPNTLTPVTFQINFAGKPNVNLD